MTILWCGNELIDFPNGAEATRDTDGNRRRSDWQRTAIKSTSSLALLKSMVFPEGEITSGWLGCYMGSYGCYSNDFYIGLGKSGTDKALYMGLSRTVSYKAGLTKYDGGWVDLANESGTSFVNQNKLYKIDMYVGGYGASVNVRMYINGLLMIDFTGDNTLSGVTGFDSVFIKIDNGGASEIIVADEDTRLMGLKSLVPNASGDTNEWINDYDSIDECPYSDADYIEDDTTGHIFQCGLTGMPAGISNDDYSVKAVRLAVRAMKGASAPDNIKLGIKSGGSSDAGVDQALDTGFQQFERIMQINPMTSLAFTPAEIETLQMQLTTGA